MKVSGFQIPSSILILRLSVSIGPLKANRLSCHDYQGHIDVRLGSFLIYAIAIVYTVKRVNNE